MLEVLASDFRGVLQDILVVTICLAAFVWGGGPERAAAVTWVLVFEVPGAIYRSLLDPDTKLTVVDAFSATTDVVAAICWVAIALYANRNYTLWIAAMQVLAVTAHMARGLLEALSPIAHLSMTVAPGYLQLAFLGVGLVRHIRRKQKHGPYRDWRVPQQWPSRVADNPIREQIAAALGYDFFAKKDER